MLKKKMTQNRNTPISSVVKTIMECLQYVDTTVYFFYTVLFGYHVLCTPQKHLVEEAESDSLYCGVRLQYVVT